MSTALHFSLLICFCSTGRSLSFSLPTVETRHVHRFGFSQAIHQSSHNPRVQSHLNLEGREQIDELLSENKLSEVIIELNSKEIPLSRDRFIEIFRVVEEQTKQVQENVRDEGEWFRRTSSARTEMTSIYKTLQSLGYLQVFGAATNQPSTTNSLSSALDNNSNTNSILNLPAQGSKIITPTMLETITSLPLSALTPKPSNTLFVAGSIAALSEILVSLWTGIDLNILVLSSLLVLLLDRVLVSGANVETLLRWLYPDSTRKIIHHEAGHFLLAYLLGCPVEGIVLSTWAALKDSRFGGGPSRTLFRSTVSAGTSFFDPELSYEMNRPIPSIRRTSIDKYSIIVMGGIAAEAMIYEHAEGGAGDEAALISFLSNIYLNKNKDKSRRDSSADRTSDFTDIELIKNQARFGVLQAVLLLRLYRSCYDALVETLERGQGSLGECINAIEIAAKKNNLRTISGPIGYIEDDGKSGNWTLV